MNQSDILSRKDHVHDELHFNSFTNWRALELGLGIVAVTEEPNYPIAIDIERNTQQIFHYSREGASEDNVQWIERKNRVVNRFGKSSSCIKTLLSNSGSTIENMYYLDSREYCVCIGAFLLLIRNVGPISAITVSGLSDEEDHSLVVSVVREFVEREKAGKSA